MTTDSCCLHIAFVDCAVQCKWILPIFLTCSSVKGETKHSHWQFLIEYWLKCSRERSCSPWGTTGIVSFDSGVVNSVFLVLFLCFSVGPSSPDVWVDSICLVLKEVDAGVVKFILLFCWMSLCCSWRDVIHWPHVQLTGQTEGGIGGGCSSKTLDSLYCETNHTLLSQTTVILKLEKCFTVAIPAGHQQRSIIFTDYKWLDGVLYVDPVPTLHCRFC